MAPKDKTAFVLPKVGLRGHHLDVLIEKNATPPPKIATAQTQSACTSPVPVLERVLVDTNPTATAPNHISPPNPSAMPSPTTDAPSGLMPIQGVVAPDERFGLLGIGCGDWLLLADQAYVNQASYELWQSLAQALQKQYPNIIVLQFSYPLFADAEGYHRHPTPALLGFLLGLHAHKRLYLGLLSAWSQSIVLGDLLTKQQDIPSLEQMQQKPLLKKQLWHTLVSTIPS